VRYRCPHCPVECEVIDGEIIPCADHRWAVPEPMLVEPPIEEQTQGVEEAIDGLSKR
jgi:hypothetical protein